MNWFRIGFFVLLLVMASNAGSASEPPKTTWQKNGFWDISIQGAIGKMRAGMVGAGFREKYEIKLDDKGHRFLYLWESGSRKVIYMLWSISIDRTGYSWGEYYDRRDK